MAEKLRTGVIGVGAMGANHARAFQELPASDLVAIADVDAARRGLVVAGGGLREYGAYQEMLAEARLDAVSIAVPTRLHAEVALACIERRVPVLVEKPLSASLDEGERLRAASEEHGVPLMVGHIERFNPAVQELKRRLDAGELGRVIQVRARRVGPFFPRERDIGVVHDLATHDIDIFHHLLGCEVQHVEAETQVGLKTKYDDALLGLLRFENGVIGVLEVNWLTPAKTRELSVLGERGMFVVDYLSQTLSWYPSDAGDGAGRGDAHGEVRAFPEPGRAPLHAELAAFLRVASGRELPAVGASEGIQAMRVADALGESAARGERVRLGAGRVAG